MIAYQQMAVCSLMKIIKTYYQVSLNNSRKADHLYVVHRKSEIMTKPRKLHKSQDLHLVYRYTAVCASSLFSGPYIRKTCPCNEYPLKPHFYIEKMGYAGVYLFFLFLLQNIDCGYSLEPPRRGDSNVYQQSMF